MGKVKCLKASCTFNGDAGNFRVYVGQPASGFHPLHFQAAWLHDTRGGVIVAEVMDRVTDLLGQPALEGTPEPAPDGAEEDGSRLRRQSTTQQGLRSWRPLRS